MARPASVALPRTVSAARFGCSFACLTACASAPVTPGRRARQAHCACATRGVRRRAPRGRRLPRGCRDCARGAGPRLPAAALCEPRGGARPRARRCPAFPARCCIARALRRRILAQLLVACYLHFAWLSASVKSIQWCLSGALLAAAAGYAHTAAGASALPRAHGQMFLSHPLCRQCANKLSARHASAVLTPALARRQTTGAASCSTRSSRRWRWPAAIRSCSRGTPRRSTWRPAAARARPARARPRSTPLRPPRAAASRRCERPAPQSSTGVHTWMYERMCW